jgi:Transposase DDE domain
MLETFNSHSLSADFFAPLSAAFTQCRDLRVCSALPDAHWLGLALWRVLESLPSGRGFLQSLLASAGSMATLVPRRSTYFEALKSPRRLRLVEQAAAEVCRAAHATLPDALAQFPELKGWDVHAADGHFWEAATHDQKSYRRGCKDHMAKFATGNIFSLCLRTHLMSHLVLADQKNRRKEHDLSALKRLGIAQLRQGAPTGRKVLYVYDRAIIDYAFWRELKARGIYILTRNKANLDTYTLGEREWDAQDPLNANVVADQWVNGGGEMLRKLTYRAEPGGEVFEFITNISCQRVPPGLLALLYKMRWDIEKVFDETKTKLGESKAWASSANAKTMQANVVALTHNLLLLYEHHLVRAQNIRNVAEEERRAQRLQKLKTEAAKHGWKIPPQHQCIPRLTQRSVKFIRWLRRVLLLQPPPELAYASLRQLYASI